MPGGTLAELGRGPNLLTLSRVPLALVFARVVDRPHLAAAVLGIAGLTDVLDGWWARRSKHPTTLGKVLDPIADKVLFVTVAISLVAAGRVPLWGVPLLLLRDLAEVVAGVWLVRHPSELRAHIEHASVPVAGKLATFGQFLVACAALVAPATVPVCLVVAGVAGAVAGATYARRELR